MRKHTALYLAAAISLTIGVFCASDFILVRSSKIVAIPFYIATGVLAYTSYSIWKWGKQPTEKQLKDKQLCKDIRSIKNDYARGLTWELWEKLQNIERIYTHNADCILASNNIQALQMLLDSYIKLENTKFDINNGMSEEDNETDFLHEITSTQTEIDNSKDNEIIESKKAILELLQKRWHAFKKRKANNDKIDVQLEWIDAQFNLALENAALKPVEISATIKVASDILMTPECDDSFRTYNPGMETQ